MLDGAELDAHMDGQQVAFGLTPSRGNNSPVSDG